MATANNIVTAALVELAILEAGGTASAEDAATGLERLNRMLHGWEIEYGIDLGHADLVLTDTVTLPDSHLRAVELNLALALAAPFETVVRDDTSLFARRGLRALQAAYADVPEMGMDKGLRSRLATIGGSERFNG